MSEADLVIHGGRIVSPEAVFEASLAIEGGVIVAVGRAELMPRAAATIDAKGLHLLPGIVDPHVHFRAPGYEYKEDWASGTAAAACGGVTTVFEMPNTNPPTATLAALKIKQEAAKRGAYVDYGIYGLLNENNLDQLEALAAAGVVGFKCFMGNTFGDLPAPSDGAMLEGFEIIAKLGKRIVVHAENPSILARREQRLQAAGRNDPLAHLAARPAICEVEAVGRAIAFAEWTGARLHIAHLSSKDAIPLVRAGKARGVDVTAETCPHYLLLTSEDMVARGNVMRVNPPVRDPGHAEPLWQALIDGTIDMLASDHAPHALHEKTDPNVWKCCSGIPGVETAVSLMLTEVARARLSLTHYVRVSSANPARAWGLYPKKGVLQVGSDADLALVDLARDGVIEAGRLHSKSRITPFEGERVKGLPVLAIVRGRIVAREGELVADPGGGQPAHQAMPAAAPRNSDLATAAILCRAPRF
ncbi:MAG: allantoinase AllB [Pseudomonadota bacterium]